MRILKRGDANIEKFIYQQTIQSNVKYRLSLYVFFKKEKRRYFIMHTMTREIIELTILEWISLLQLKEETKDYNFITQHELIELLKKNYIIQEDFDEVYAYSQILFSTKSTQNKKSGYNSYVILPTTGCNARCIYCYEEGVVAHHMNETTANRLSDFICENKGYGTVSLKWFGGEPLAASNIIRLICNTLAKRSVDFTSSIITNATLLTKELAHEARERWHLNFAQVSLDGAREDYEERKRYVRSDKYNYDTVMTAIQYLANENINVSLRVNVDMKNIQHIDDFLNEIALRFGNNKKVTLYLYPLFQELHSENCEAIWDAVYARKDKIRALGLSYDRGSNSKFKLNYCMADSVDNNIVILPDGTFNHCEHITLRKCWGNIFDGVTDPVLFNELKQINEIDSNCAKCTFLPFCTPFYRHGCPNWYDKCYIMERKEAEEEIHMAILNQNIK